MAHGGKRKGAGRKSKAEEQSLIEKLTPLEDSAFSVLSWALSKKESWAVKLFFDYMYGKPGQKLDVTTKGESLNYSEEERIKRIKELSKKL